MREMVLIAYEHQCAFCAYDVIVGTAPVGFEAVPVCWSAFDGPEVGCPFADNEGRQV
ncbi:hypothetical protein ACF1BA_15980 [Streptomyces rubiginosohelvolus]|uniref:hypothetical protein n=1 Tax=Streptomyces rubiginosohelvolus TaxID=67362 RepID=UPI0037010209